jgi:hypothetical protein
MNTVIAGEKNPALNNLRKNSRQMGMLNAALHEPGVVGQNASAAATNITQPDVLAGINMNRNSIARNNSLTPVEEQENMGETIVEGNKETENKGFLSSLFGGRRRRRQTNKRRTIKRKISKKHRTNKRHAGAKKHTRKSRRNRRN